MHCILQATMQNLFIFIIWTFFNITRGNRPQNCLLLSFFWCSSSFWIKHRKTKENIVYHVVYKWKNSYQCCTEKSTLLLQRAKNVVSDSPGLVDFAIGLVNSILYLPDRQVKFFEGFKLQKNYDINLLIKTFLGLVEMMFGLVNVSFSLPEWQAVKMTFFAPCTYSSKYGTYTQS